jgi:hypothetical protein
MHLPRRAGPLLLALGIAVVIGCNQSSDPQTKASRSQPQAKRDTGPVDQAGKSASLAQAKAPGEWTLSIEGMT